MEIFVTSHVHPPAGGTRCRGSRVAGLLVTTVLLTAACASSAQAASVGLGTADSFAVLAGTAVTNTGPSVIAGDLGVTPGAAVTGFPPGLVTAGTVHAADAAALQAQGDLTTAYNDAAGRPSTSTISANLAGSTLTSGVYTSASSLGLSGDLTLDGQGDPNAVFVFQAGSTLTVGSSSHVLFVGGARACNVFWQVGSSATVGSGSAFAGNILALTSISMTTGATLHGRALARNGAVTLDTNTITKATCATPPAGSTPPSASGTSATTTGGPVTVSLHGSDAAGAPLTFVITGAPAHGTLGPIDQRAGTVTYTPAAGYAGPDRFTYLVTSPNGSSSPATATITVVRAGAGGSVAPQGGSSAPGSATARLRGPQRCVEGAFTAKVTGRHIAQVTFFVDGVRRRIVRSRAGRSVFSLRVDSAGQSVAAHRVTARVRFTTASGARTRTLRLVYQRCSTAAVRPRFTG
jgi:Ice-binding-like/Bacterial Ig domain